ncbi:MAG: SMC-Scp complex subunit ScpB [Oscillospiraceae bacterium]|jgi:segregation and condensation protein B|nr:SMC-Scp complex subunit ScpB [Oscillospiraceae bacterium]
MNYQPILEAILFVSGEPVSIEKLAEACGVTKREIMPDLERLERRYSDADCGLSLLKLGHSYQLATRKEYAPYVKTAIEIRRMSPLSPAAMEALAIIAYNQPVSRAFVEQVRGIDSSSVVNTLVERGLAEEAGRLDLPGKPIAYRTTENFLRCFGLKNLSQLPPLPGEKEQLSFDEETP